MSSSSKIGYTSYIPSLDGLRALSILIVATAHAGFGNFVPGGLGVTIFFFLSGFLITGVLEREYERSATIGILAFLKRRAFRLYPALIISLFIGDLLVYFGIIPGGVTAKGTVAQLAYFANYYSIFFDSGNTTPRGMGILWSLAVEEHFYLLYPLFFLFMISRFSRTSRAVVLLIASFCVLMWRIYIYHHGLNVSDRIYYCTDTRVDAILWGCLLATVAPGLGTNPIEKATQYSFTLFSVGLLLLLSSLLVRNEIFRDTLRYTLQSVALLPIFFHLLNVKRGVIHHFLNMKMSQSLGKLSYGFYLIHFVIIEILSRIDFFSYHRFLLLGMTTLLASFYSLIVTQYFEKPIRRKYNNSIDIGTSVVIGV